MEILWLVFFLSILNLGIFIALIVFVVSAVRKPTPFKKKVLIVLAMLFILSAAVQKIAGEPKFFSDDEMSYSAIMIGKTSQDELFELYPPQEDDITFIEGENLTAVDYDSFTVYLRGNTVWQIDITEEGEKENIFDIKIGDKLDTVKIKLPRELKEENVYDLDEQEQLDTKDSGYLVHFYDDGEYTESCIIIFSASGDRCLLMDLDSDNKVSKISYRLMP